MSRSYNYISKKYGYKYYGDSISERTGCRRECSKKVRHTEYLALEGLSSEELLNKEMALYKTERYQKASADEQQMMISALDMQAAMEYSFIAPIGKIKGTVCW